MASFGMVYSGAPLFMWIWAFWVAVFINNITASYFSREKVWATPYELIHGEPFPDASIIVPFGCAALVLFNEQDLRKFTTRVVHCWCSSIMRMNIHCTRTHFTHHVRNGFCIDRIASS